MPLPARNPQQTSATLAQCDPSRRTTVTVIQHDPQRTVNHVNRLATPRMPVRADNRVTTKRDDHLLNGVVGVTMKAEASPS